MSDTVEVTIPVDAETAQALENPIRRAAAGRYLTGMLKGGRARELLEEAIADLKSEAHARGLTDADVDAELAAWRAEREA